MSERLREGARSGPSGQASAEAGDYANKWLILATLGVGTFLSVLDGSVVNISLPTITRELQTDVTTIQWVIMGYLLTITGLLLPFGRLADLIGRKTVYVTGMAIFAATVGLCGAVSSVEQLIALRVIEGVGSAMVMAIAPAITASAFPRRERGKALGINSTIVAIGGVSGPVLGGVLSDLFDWRWVFYFRVPFGLLAVLLAAWVLPSSRQSGRRRFDLLGSALLFVWLGALTYGLNQGGNLGWGSAMSLGIFAVAVLGFVAFIVVETRTDEPTLQLAVFRNRLFTASSLSSLLSFMASFSTAFLMPFYLVQVLGFPPSTAGLMLIPQPLAMSVVAPLSGWLSDRLGSRLLCTAGLGIACLSLAALATLNAGSTYPEIALRLAALGVGLGIFQSPNGSAILSALPSAQMGIASGMLATMRNLGMAVGTAVVGAVWTGRVAFHAASLAAANVEAAVQQTESLVGGFQDALLVAAAISSIGVVASLVRGEHRPTDGLS